ncbi:HD domain-containing protein [Asticcacaulis sp. AND118]|uniref:HD domain-containing protein n=1 Tax=Asticcacaulis sp. AND118 TaxID=2840468 RepID=UPI001CFFF2BB|nr:HD domain-containing protein [Asticcacaulis sp. AND118]UDF02644.1 HD domain-containing protein [Asticcacaulis sp. AND118]
MDCQTKPVSKGASRFPDAQALQKMMAVRLSPSFAPHEALAEALLPHVLDNSDDGSHDVSHLQRVFKVAMTLSDMEAGDSEIVAAAVLLHDCVQVEKNSPLRRDASRLSAEKAREILAAQDWDEARIDAVAHAIHTHSFSANVMPETLEAKIVQDADRMDAIGFVGIARCFYTAGRMNTALYDPFDPKAEERELDDLSFALDHFETKLFKLKSGFQTTSGRDMADLRHARMKAFIEYLHEEI